MFLHLSVSYLNYFYVPLVKLSFYAGSLEYSNAVAVLRLQANCKREMNTNGNGWRLPRLEWFKPNRFRIDALNQTIGDSYDTDHPPCLNLILSDDEDDAESNNRMLVSLPKLEFANEPQLGNVWLPFKRKHNFNLAARSSAFILLRYYVAVQKCYAFKSASPKKFHRRLADWLSDRILPHIEDDEFYPGLGAVLRIMETLQSPGKRAVVRNDQMVITKEPHKSKEFEQIEQQVDEIIKERQKPGFFERFLLAASSQRDDQARGSRLLAVAILAALVCIFILATACCWTAGRRKGPVAGDLKRSARKGSSPRRKWYSRWTFRKQPPPEDEIECAPNSPSIMSRTREAELCETNLNGKYTHSVLRKPISNVIHIFNVFFYSESNERLERAGSRLYLKKANREGAVPSKRSAVKVTKSCSLTPSQRRRLNSSKQSTFRPFGIDSYRPDLSTTSAASLSDYTKDNVILPPSPQPTLVAVAPPIKDNDNASGTDTSRSSLRTRIPVPVPPLHLDKVQPTETVRKAVRIEEHLPSTGGKSNKLVIFKLI